MRRSSLSLFLLFAASACTEKTPGRILLFDGFGTPSGAHISGRVVENLPPKPGAEDRSGASNLIDNALAFETDEIPGVVVELELAGRKISAVCDQDGVFTAELPGPLSEGSVTVSARTTEDKGHPTPPVSGVVHIFADRDGVVVISDFDDTIVKTEVTDPVHMISNTLLRNAAQVPLIEGVEDAFEDARAAGAGFFYLSGSPHNLYERISEILKIRKMPRGPVLLKNFGSDPLIEQEGYKTRRLRELAKTFPKMRFVLIGDTGERDPEIYRALAKELPGRVAGILIRRTAGSNMDPARFEGCTLVDDYRASPIVALIKTSTRAAEPAAQ